MQEILVEHVMSRDVPVIPASQTLELAVRQMAAGSLSCIIAVEEDNRPVGILTERDMLSLAASMLDGEREWNEPVAEHMSTGLIYLHPEQSLFEALVVARARSVRHLPVLDGQHRLVGLVTATELMRAHFNVFESQRQAEEDTVSLPRDDFMSMRLLSLEDPLMDIGNRRALEADLKNTEATSRRYQHYYSVAMFDVDHFKGYNDSYGHPSGDKVLRRIADVFKEELRNVDRVYRYGGEELTLLMPETRLSGAVQVAERLRSRLQAEGIPYEQGEFGVVTVSGGVAEGGFREQDKGWPAVLEAADRALYLAKRSGRNRIESDSGSSGG